MKNSLFKFVSLTFCVGILAFPLLLHAQASKTPAPDYTGELTKAGDAAGVNADADNPTLPTIVGNVIKAALVLIGTIFLILFVYGGILWMTARGNSEQTEKAKKIITEATIGLLIVLGAWAVTAFVLIAALKAASIKTS